MASALATPMLTVMLFHGPAPRVSGLLTRHAPIRACAPPDLNALEVVEPGAAAVAVYPILSPSTAPDGSFDSASIGSCVVLPPLAATSSTSSTSSSSDDGLWRMWYSGRPIGFASDVMPIATGYVGLAVSNDGLSWRRLAGEEEGGAVFGPSGSSDGGFDATHVAVGDVKRRDDGRPARRCSPTP